MKDRPAFIARQCAGNERLERRMHRLLAAHERARDAGSGIFRREPQAAEFGSYRFLRELGEGGMGIVYLAEETRPPKRLVALKVVKRGMRSKEVVARLDAERRALASMDHPHIARIFDAGTSRSGRPFFVMEYVPGQPIGEYCTERELSLDARLRLFVDVSMAVQHAHDRGIIHRDLKPSNLLVMDVDGRPVPKVIDFGIAKATGHRPVQIESSRGTELETIVGTPEYMSPEQADPTRRDVDARSDVYSLGVILYELLAGSLPYGFGESSDLADILRAVREDEPVPPSRRAASREPALVKGDLDAITMMALAKDPAERYPTAQALAEDVLRYLSHEPIRALHPGVDAKRHALAG